jgi:hypothetical protein
MQECWVGLPWSPRIKSDKAEAIVKPNAFLAQLSKKSGHPRPAAASAKCRYQMHRVFQNFIDLLSSAKARKGRTRSSFCSGRQCPLRAVTL